MFPFRVGILQIRDVRDVNVLAMQLARLGRCTWVQHILFTLLLDTHDADRRLNHRAMSVQKGGEAVAQRQTFLEGQAKGQRYFPIARRCSRA